MTFSFGKTTKRNEIDDLAEAKTTTQKRKLI